MLLAFDGASPPGADISFNGPMLAMPYSLQRLGFTYVRNSLKTVYQGGSLVTLSANQFGTTYDAVTGLHAYEAEPAATNLALNSAGAAATWTVSNVTDAGTPITGFAASLAFGDNSVDRTAYKPIALTATTVYSVSIFIQMDDGLAPVVGTNTSTGDFILVTDSAVHTATALVTSIGGGLYRVSSARTASTGGASRLCGVRKAVGQSARTFRIVGIQVETGSRATSYIATAGATVTRAADVLSGPTANIPGFNAAGYTMFVDGRRDVATGTNGECLAVTDASGNNQALIRFTSAAAIQTRVLSNAVTVASTSEGAPTTARFKVAYSCALDSFMRALNGTAGTAAMLGAMPITPTTFGIGNLNGATQFNGFIYGFRLIPVALNQAQTTGQTA